MTGKRVRSLTTALLLAGLAVPAIARPAPSTPEPQPSLLLQIWEWLSAPFVALFDSADSDGRGVWDPNGLPSGDAGDTDAGGINRQHALNREPGRVG